MTAIIIIRGGESDTETSSDRGGLTAGVRALVVGDRCCRACCGDNFVDRVRSRASKKNRVGYYAPLRVGEKSDRTQEDQPRRLGMSE